MRKIRTSRLFPWPIVGIFLLSSFILMITTSFQESAIMDELAHVPAGYGYVRFLDYRLNPEHPPLVKALAALPLLFEGLTFPTDASSWTKDVNGQWQAGAQFLYESGNNADSILQTARVGPMILTLILIFFVYIWASELVGRWWGLLPTFLVALSPTVLAHGHFVTTDIGAALGIFISSYYFVKHLIEPSPKRLVWAGLTFGIAQLAKFSAVLLIPFFLFLVIIFLLWKIRNELYDSGFIAKLLQILKFKWSALLAILGVFFIGYLLVYSVYFVFTINYPIERQVSDTTFTLTSFSGGPDPNHETCSLISRIDLGRRMRCLAEIDIAMSKNAITRPLAQYMLGVLMVTQRSSGGNTGYFWGEVSASGWWYYFPVVFGIKEPIPSLMLIGLGLILGFWRALKKIRDGLRNIFHNLFEYVGTNFAEFAMISFVVLYWLYSMKSPLNIGVRHILPTIPFIYILATGAIKKWITEKLIIQRSLWKTIMSAATNLLKLSLKGALVTILVVWFLIESIFAYPNYLSYFNQFAGGTDNGYRYVTDSNYDWGQDLKRLTQWTEQNKIDKIGVDYFGGGSPKYYLGNKEVDWWSSKGDPAKQGIHWLAISINTIQGAKGKLVAGQQRDSKDEYSWLQNPYEPYARAGKSIFIYKF